MHNPNQHNAITTTMPSHQTSNNVNNNGGSSSQNQRTSSLGGYLKQQREETEISEEVRDNIHTLETCLAPGEINHLYQSLKYKGAIIFRGPPGSSKSFVARKLAEFVVADKAKYKAVAKN